MEVEPGNSKAAIGTYGFISRAPAFVVGLAHIKPGGMEDFGYAMEGIALRATEMGLGSCWLGGSFDRGKARAILEESECEVITASLAIGYPAEKRTIQDRIIYGIAAGSPHARRRKELSEISFRRGLDGSWLPMDSENLLQMAKVDSTVITILEALRIAPSASNKQPWRILFDENNIHLFMDEDRFYNSALGEVKLQNVDMGIAMRHIDVASASAGRGTQSVWARLSQPPHPGKSAFLGRSPLYIASLLPR